MSRDTNPSLTPDRLSTRRPRDKRRDRVGVEVRVVENKDIFDMRREQN